MKGLVLDGGGVFGIGQAHIVSKVDISKFDFFIGTSIGSVIASVLATQGDVTGLPKFFHQAMPLIFKGWKLAKYRFRKRRYNDVMLNRYLQGLFLRQLGCATKPLFVVSANLAEQQLKVFSSKQVDDALWPLWEVCRCAVAAETYFAPWKGYADGGIFANNPSMVAVAAACKQLGANVRDIELCSIGTGSGDTSKKVVPTGEWSALRWGWWLINASLNGAANSMHEYFVRSLPLKKYKRIDFIRQPSWRMDSPVDMLTAEETWKPAIEAGCKEVEAF